MSKVSESKSTITDKSAGVVDHFSLDLDSLRTPSRGSSVVDLATIGCEFCGKNMQDRSRIIRAWRAADAKAELKSSHEFCQVTNACGAFRVNVHGSVTLLQPNGRARLELSVRELSALAAMDSEVNDDWDEELLADPSDITSYEIYPERELERNEIACGGGVFFTVVPRKILFLVDHLIMN